MAKLVLYENSAARPYWQNFCNYVTLQARELSNSTGRPVGSVEYQLRITELAKFGAHTDMSDINDPLWFPDEERKTHFMLVWG